MRDKRALIIMVTILLFFPKAIFAFGEIKVSTTSISITEGDSSSFNVIANNAAGRVDISSSNPSVASVKSNNVWVDNSSSSIVVSANSVGTSIITITLYDASTYDEEELVDTYTINVLVNPKFIEKEPSPSTNNMGEFSSKNNNKAKENTSNIKNETKEEKSSNANVIKIMANGIELNKKDDTTYYLSFSNDVEKVDLVVETEDKNATVESLNSLDLAIGENKYIVCVIAEDGTKKEYNLILNRDYNNYYLSNLDEYISNISRHIILNKGDVITSSDLEKIKKSNLIINFDMMDNDKFLYGYVIDGSKLTKLKDDFKVEIKNNLDENIDKLLKNKSGIKIMLNNNIPSPIMLRYYAGDEFSDKDVVNIYSYNSKDKRFKQVKTSKIENGILEFNIENEIYFITKEKMTNKPHNLIIIAVIVLVTVVLMCFSLIKSKLNKKRNANLYIG